MRNGRAINMLFHQVFESKYVNLIFSQKLSDECLNVESMFDNEAHQRALNNQASDDVDQQALTNHDVNAGHVYVLAYGLKDF